MGGGGIKGGGGEKGGDPGHGCPVTGPHRPKLLAKLYTERLSMSDGIATPEFNGIFKAAPT